MFMRPHLCQINHNCSQALNFNNLWIFQIIKVSEGHFFIIKTLNSLKRSKKDKSGRDFACGCGKKYLSYPALYTHIK